MGRKQRSKRRTPLIRRLDAVAAREKLSHEEIGDAIGGVDRVTVWRWRKYGRGPSNGIVRAALEKFVEAREGKVIVVAPDEASAKRFVERHRKAAAR